MISVHKHFVFTFIKYVHIQSNYIIYYTDIHWVYVGLEDIYTREYSYTQRPKAEGYMNIQGGIYPMSHKYTQCIFVL